jgi:membrane-bound lytic murein transglycosylase MltF
MKARRLNTTTVLLCVLAICAASGCSESPSNTATSQASTPQASASQASTAQTTSAPADASEDARSQAEVDADQYGLPPGIIAKKWTGDFDAMVQRRLIRVLTTYSKTNYFVDKGTQRGAVYEAFQIFETDLNKTLANKNIRVHVVFIPVANDDLIPALLDGRGDLVAAGKLATAWRKQSVDFTKPTRTGISSVVVTGPGVAPIKSLEDLGGKEVYMRQSDVSAENVKLFNEQLAKAGKPPVKLNPAPEVLSDEDILEMVNAGLAPMTIVDDDIAELWKEIFTDLTVNTGAAIRTDGETAMMIRKNSPQLMRELNAFVDRYPKGSAQWNMLFAKYLKNNRYAKRATSGDDAARFRQTVDMIRKYSDQYELDYLLMAAQGYQESGLDQNRKSPVGAIGVMQVMPATGADMKVGDITQADANIHAGVKYMRFMMDNFYKDAPMDDLNKGLMTFASYNAGPGRVSQLRKQAAARGLDPNRWFNNVEVIASEKIGRETVQYVSNIYKYYLAYKMLSEQQQLREKARGRI